MLLALFHSNKISPILCKIFHVPRKFVQYSNPWFEKKTRLITRKQKKVTKKIVPRYRWYKKKRQRSRQTEKNQFRDKYLRCNAISLLNNASLHRKRKKRNDNVSIKNWPLENYRRVPYKENGSTLLHHLQRPDNN